MEEVPDDVEVSASASESSAPASDERRSRLSDEDRETVAAIASGLADRNDAVAVLEQLAMERGDPDHGESLDAVREAVEASRARQAARGAFREQLQARKREFDGAMALLAPDLRARFDGDVKRVHEVIQRLMLFPLQDDAQATRLLEELDRQVEALLDRQPDLRRALERAA
jgi:aminopeptidase N